MEALKGGKFSFFFFFFSLFRWDQKLTELNKV